MQDTLLLRFARHGTLVVAFAIAIAPTAFAQIPSWGVDTFEAPADPRWSATAAQDVEAAFRLLRDNHPGAAPELDDLEFQQRLKSAHILALKRARTRRASACGGSGRDTGSRSKIC
jgi:hypothetical protein